VLMGVPTPFFLAGIGSFFNNSGVEEGDLTGSNVINF